ncbi:sensor histidine kinase [Comamonas composti]|uniref:sensor histidine kinase n=1 Tax=Comamonas composti TaxID=408558 RepID=UPI0003FA693F|nr:ATP-binding protein [Comamonas composti]
MALGLNTRRIWVRFGLWVTAAVLSTIALLTLGVFAFSEIQYRSFYRSLPPTVQQELDELNARELEDSPRAMEIYSQYWSGDLLFGEKWSLLIGLLVSLPFGLAVGFWVSRFVTQPLASMVEVAKRVEQGDFSVRALPGNSHGELAEMVDAFNRMIDALETLEAERRATAASISHELRTPLTVLQAHLHAMCDGVIATDRAELQTLLSQVRHLGRLVGDLHLLSIADAGQLSLQKQRLDLAQLLAGTLEQLQPQLQQHGLALDLDLPEPSDDGLYDVRADADRMRQIITNLVSNVIRHAAAGQWLGLRLTRELKGTGQVLVVLRISDAGPGLPDELRDDPFQRFAQAPGQRRREGSGLGLSIVKALTLSQGGSVQAGESERGGTCFTLRFPGVL